MKKALSTLLVPALSATLMAGAGPGPWADGAYYPGGLNGKYFGIVTGQNISGVLGFAVVDGAPPFREAENQESSGGANPIAIVNPTFGPDTLQNYFSVFVEGRVYSGITYAGIDSDANKVAGTLNGINPPALNQFTVAGSTAGAGPIPAGATEPGPSVIDSLPIVNRGLSGGFTAKIKKKQAVFTFKGTGQLSTPANPQTVSVTSVPQVVVVNPLQPPPPPPLVDGTLTNQVSTGVVTTHTTSFNLSGIRTSFIASNPQARQDESDLSSGAAGGGGGN
jgi:hypothetical protein